MAAPPSIRELTLSDGIVTPSDPSHPLSTPSASDTIGSNEMPQKVGKVVKLFENHYNGVAGEEWVSLKITPTELEHALNVLKANKRLWAYVQDKVRYDYDPDFCRFYFRRPGKRHERVLKAFADEITIQLDKFRKSHGPLADFTKLIENDGSSDIIFPSTTDIQGISTVESMNQPDQSYQFDEDEYPSVIIEVSDSQKRKDVEYLAEKYILESDNCVNLVIGIDLNYGEKGTKEAHISTWRGKWYEGQNGPELRCVQDWQRIPFRNPDGTPAQDFTFDIPLTAFSTNKKQAPFGTDLLQQHKISLTSQQLYSYLLRAEKAKRNRKNGCKDEWPAGGTWVKRSRTPEDVLTSEDEAKFIQKEDKEEELAEHDLDYEEPPLAKRRKLNRTQ